MDDGHDATTGESSSDNKLKPTVTIVETGGGNNVGLQHRPGQMETNHRCNGNIATGHTMANTLPLIVEKEPSSCEMKEISPPAPAKVKPPVPVRQSTLSTVGQHNNMAHQHHLTNNTMEAERQRLDSSCYLRYDSYSWKHLLIKSD